MKLSDINPSSELPHIIEYVDLESVKGTTLISHQNLDINLAPSRAKRLARKGDIFYQTVRPYQKNNYYFEKSSDNFVFSTGYTQIRPTKINGLFLFYKIQVDKFVNEVLKKSTGTSYPSINSKDLSKIKFYIPKSIQEQFIIGRFLEKLEDIITLEQEKLDTIIELKKHFLRKMYAEGNGKKQFKLEKFISKRGEINKENKKYIVSSVNNKEGFVRQREQFENSRLDHLDKSKYRIVNPNEFAFNPSRINVGSIGLNDTKETLIVSPLYVVFRLDRLINKEYLKYFTETEKFSYEVNRNTEGSVRQSLTFENLGNINIPLPDNYDTQLRIVNLFEKLDNIIIKIEQKTTNYNSFKAYLLQNLFV